MKKVISILLAVAAFAFAAPAFADVSISGSKNNMTTLPVASSGTLPIFRTGDTFTINLTGLTEGQLTLLTYKSSDGSSSDFDDAYEEDNIQYIYQYTVDATGVLSIEYIVRSTEAGVYCIKINNGGNLTLTAYYRMGDVTVYSVASNGDLSDGYTASYHQEDYAGGYSLGFVGKATLAKGGTFADAGVNLGFRLKGGKFGNEGYLWADAISGARIDAYFDDIKTELGVDGIELDGSYSVIYGLTVYNVPEAYKDVITAKAESDVYAE